MSKTSFPFLYDFDLKREYRLNGRYNFMIVGLIMNTISEGVQGFKLKTEKLLPNFAAKEHYSYYSRGQSHSKPILRYQK